MEAEVEVKVVVTIESSGCAIYSAIGAMWQPLPPVLSQAVIAAQSVGRKTPLGRVRAEAPHSQGKPRTGVKVFGQWN